MTNETWPPYFVFDKSGNDVAIFGTLEAAQAFVEPPDVDDAEVFDGLGRRYHLVVAGRKVSMSPCRDDPSMSALQRRIMAFLAAIQQDEGLADLEWPDFIRESSERIAVWQKL